MTSERMADVTTYHIEGIAREGNVPFSVPLISHIEENLWQGGCIDGLTLPPEIKYVVSLYPWEAYQVDLNVARLEYALMDSSHVADAGTLDMLGRIVNDFLERGPTLVHCQAGLNRSALVTVNALALAGRPVAESIALLRERRSPAVLSNAAFENWLRERWASPAPTKER